MKIVVIAGTPGAGKTAVLIHVLKQLKEQNQCVSVVKIDCLYTEDHFRFQKIGVPVLIGLSKDMCPDHYTIYNFGDMLEFAQKNKSDILIIETAGLCHRCAPYTKNSLGVCVIDATTGPNTPLKVGPFLSTANIVAITKGDVISQAEREIFRERVLEMNPGCRIIEANGLTGKGASELALLFCDAGEFSYEDEVLRHNAPFSICTLCVGETKIHKKHHFGVLRHISGIQKYAGE